MHTRQSQLNMLILAVLIALVALLRCGMGVPGESPEADPVADPTTAGVGGRLHRQAGAPPGRPVQAAARTGQPATDVPTDPGAEDRIRLPGFPASDVLDIHVVALHGTGVVAAGAPLVLRWEQMPSPDFFDVAWADRPLASGTTDAEGRLTWSGVKPLGPLRRRAANACLVVRAVAPWYGRKVLAGPRSGDADSTWAFDAPTDPGTGHASIHVETYAVHGRRVVGTVRREDGVPVPGARFLPDRGRRCETDASGDYDLLVGAHDRSLRALGPPQARIQGVTQPLPEPREDGVMYLDFVLPGLGGIEVRLVDGLGEPRAGLRPWLVPEGSTLESQRWAQHWDRVTDPRHAPDPIGLVAQERGDGVYVFAAVPVQGAFDLRLEHSGGAGDVVVAEALQAGIRATFVVPSDLVNVTFAFVDAATDEPVAGAGTIQWTAADRTELDGLATRAVGLVDVGTAPRVEISLPGYAPIWRTLELPRDVPDPVVTLTLQPVRGGPVVSVRYATHGVELSGTHVPPPRVHGEDGGLWQPAWTRREDAWTTQDLPPGDYLLRPPPEVGGLARGPGDDDAAQRGALHLVCMPPTPLHVGVGPSDAVALLLPAGALRVTFRDARGTRVLARRTAWIGDGSGPEQPLPLREYWPGPGDEGWLEPDSIGGGGLSRGLAPGNYRVHATHRGMRSPDVDVQIEAGRIHDVTLTLAR